MNDFREILDLGQFAGAVRAVAIIVPVLAIVIGLVYGVLRKELVPSLVRSVAIGLLGPVIYGLWLMYSSLIRYDPRTGYVGLHRVSVLLTNVAIFAVVGVVLGLVYRRVFRTAAPAEAVAEPDTHSV